MKSPVTRSRGLAIAAIAAFAVALVPVGAATAAPAAKCDNRNNNTISKLLECVDADGAMEHLEAFQEIADENGGNRAAGTSGYEASVDYVVDTLEAAGWNVSIDEFDFTFVGASTLQQITPVNASYPTGPFTGSGPGDVTAAVTPVDVQLTTPNTNTSGCEAADFAGFPAGNIALIQRGSCNFSVKALNADAAGASAVILFNAGDNAADPSRFNLIVGTLGGPDVVDIPVVGASFEQGVALAQAGSTARVTVPLPELRPQKNVIAELPRHERRQRRDGRCAPRFGSGGPGHQRQRQRIRFAARGRPEPVEAQARRTPCASHGGVQRRPACWGLRRTWTAFPRPRRTASRCT